MSLSKSNVSLKHPRLEAIDDAERSFPHKVGKGGGTSGRGADFLRLDPGFQVLRPKAESTIQGHSKLKFSLSWYMSSGHRGYRPKLALTAGNGQVFVPYYLFWLLFVWENGCGTEYESSESLSLAHQLCDLSKSLPLFGFLFSGLCTDRVGPRVPVKFYDSQSSGVATVLGLFLPPMTCLRVCHAIKVWVIFWEIQAPWIHCPHPGTWGNVLLREPTERVLSPRTTTF